MKTITLLMPSICGLLDGLNLPHAVVVEAQIRLHECVEVSLVGEVAVKSAGSGAGKTGAAGGRAPGPRRGAGVAGAWSCATA